MEKGEFVQSFIYQPKAVEAGLRLAKDSHAIVIGGSSVISPYYHILSGTVTEFDVNITANMCVNYDFSCPLSNG